jgi:di/tricarboxylate transporter
LTPQITLTLSILGFTILLFVTEKLRVDLVALLVLGILALTGLVSPEEAVSGFSNPAVVTVWAVFILSGGLSRTGLANLVGRQVLRLAGTGEIRLLVVIMLAAGVMSAFMNNVGVAALLLPVVIDIARRTGHPPSKLLMPLAFGCLLGGLTTLIGTPPNILASDILRDAGLQPFKLFDFFPVGITVMLSGIAFMALVGRRLLPDRDMAREFRGRAQADLGQVFDLEERLFVIRLPEDSTLDGKTLAESRLGSALSLNVIGIMRDGNTRLAPEPGAVLRAGDRLLVIGRPDRLIELNGQKNVIIRGDEITTNNLTIESLASKEVEIVEVSLSSRSKFIGQSLTEIDLRQRFGVNVLATYAHQHARCSNKCLGRLIGSNPARKSGCPARIARFPRIWPGSHGGLPSARTPAHDRRPGGLHPGG